MATFVITKKIKKTTLFFSLHRLSLSLFANNISDMQRTRIVNLVSSSDTGNIPVRFPIPTEDGTVDLAEVGGIMGLDPATVRLNGHFLSRGPDLVSSVTWASLLSFFSVRGFPAGESDRDPVLVQGRPGPTGTGLHSQLHSVSELKDEDYLSFKRKISLGDEKPSKKNRLFVNGSGEENNKNVVGRMETDDMQPFKKAKMNHHNPGLASEASKLSTISSRTRPTYNCISGSKHLREDEMPMSISCKRIK